MHSEWLAGRARRTVVLQRNLRFWLSAYKLQETENFCLHVLLFVNASDKLRKLYYIYDG